MIYAVVWRGTNMIVTGFSLILLGQGLANFLYAQNQDRLPTFEPLGELDFGPLSGIPLVGPVLLRQNALLVVTLGLALVVAVLLRGTRFGLEVDASGSDPPAATAKGVSVRRTRSLGVLTAGLLAGLGGAAITVGSVGNFGSNIKAGRGFVAISLVAVARGRIGWVLVAAFLFGTLGAAQARLQDVEGIPVELLPALPWIALTVALVVMAVTRMTSLRRAG
jgi:simple sugar transport system permease protein